MGLSHKVQAYMSGIASEINVSLLGKGAVDESSFYSGVETAFTEAGLGVTLMCRAPCKTTVTVDATDLLGWGGVFATVANLAHLERSGANSHLQKKKMMLNFLPSVRETGLEKFQEHFSQMTDGKIILQNPCFSVEEQNTCPCFPYTLCSMGLNQKDSEEPRNKVPQDKWKSR